MGTLEVDATGADGAMVAKAGAVRLRRTLGCSAWKVFILLSCAVSTRSFASVW